MKDLIKNIVREDNFLSLAGNVVIALLGVFGFAILARSYSLEVFGEWVLFITASSFIEMFRFGITNTGLIRYLSGADKSKRVQLIGSNALLSLAVTIVIALIIFLSNVIFPEAVQNSGFHLFFRWYPILAFLNLPWNNALVLLQADRKFGKILILKSINSICFFLVIAFNALFLDMSLTQLIWSFLVINTLTSTLSMIARWDGLIYLFKAGKDTNIELLHFGKYTTFTLIGSNLLRSADTLIISLSPLGNEAVALFSIPLKLTELQLIPLRSFTATAFPKMSEASMKHKIKDLRQLFYTYTGAMTYLLVLISACTFIFADLFVLLLAGEKFLVPDAVTGINAADIVRVFSFYGLLLPIDRMTGIALDSINKPQINALKVLVMVISNILGDLIAVFLFESLILVAFASIIFTLIGIGLGMYFLKKEISISYGGIFSAGIDFYKSMFLKFKDMRQNKNFNLHPKSIK